jgi:NADP-dependent 3-hydroxy acid dehydrogenase YdfG
MLVMHGLDPIQNGDLDDWDAMIDINVKDFYMFLSHHPSNKRKSGHIINRPTAAKEVYPNGNVYCATNMPSMR